MKLDELLAVMERVAPLRDAESWDNVGLLVGDSQQAIHKAMLTIDYTAEVAEEARRENCDVIISYHPPIFDPLKRITAGSLIYDAIRRGVAIYSPHTALDVADGGTNDMLADVLGLSDRRPLRLAAAASQSCKLVVFVPANAADAVASALFAAGAGRIGNYTSCSFRSPGTGTFHGEAGSNPAVGKAGQLERVEEIRLEMVLPLERVSDAIKALRRSHPYEEPAFDLVALAPPPADRGQGRIGTFSSAVTRESLFARIKAELDLKYLLISGPTTGTISEAACCAGSCGDLLDDALAQRAELYLTGELRHHDALRAAQQGLTVVCALHSNSERAVLNRVAKRLAAELPGLEVVQSRVDRDPFAVL